jgi:hypothetical protein
MNSSIVVIEVSGGIAEPSVVPSDVEVIIVDFDRAVNYSCPFCDERVDESEEALEAAGQHSDMHPECFEKYTRIKEVA